MRAETSEQKYATVRAKDMPLENIRLFWETFRKDRLGHIVFYDGAPESFEDFYAWLVRYDKDARFIVGSDGAKALYWLNNVLGKSVMIHFCFLRAAFAEQTQIGLYTVKSLLTYRDGKGEAAVSCLMGITPKPYRHALAFIQKLGFQIKAEIPLACYFERQGKFKNAVVSLLTEQDIKEEIMGGGGKSYKAPEAKPVEVPAPAPVEADQSVKQAGDDERRRRASAGTQTVLTGGSGLGTSANTQKKTLLGG